MNCLLNARLLRAWLTCFIVVLLVGSATRTAAGQRVEDLSGEEEAAFLLNQDPLTNAAAQHYMSADDWTEFGNRVSTVLAAGHDGLRQGALRLVIMYGRRLDLDRAAIFDMVRMYRSHENERVRRMAVVALAETEDAWCMDFLKRSIRFENEQAVRHTLMAAVAAYRPTEIEVGPPERIDL